MKRFALIFALGLLACCSSNENVERKTPVFAWESAGLSVDFDEAERLGSGIEAVASVGEYLFARNDRRLDGKRSYQLFFGKAGSLLWKELKLPDGDIPNVLFADSGALYVGTFFSFRGARLWKFFPDREMWTEIPLPVLDKKFPISDSAYGIDGIAKFRGRLVLSFSSGRSGEQNPVYFETENGSWKNGNKGFPPEESFLRAAEWNGSLFAMTYGSGVYRFDTADLAWHRVKAPEVVCENGPWNDSSTLSRDAVPFDGKLLVGYANLEGAFALSPEGSWSQQTECSLLQKENGSVLVARAFPSVYRFVPFRGGHIALGEGSAFYSANSKIRVDLPPISGVPEILDGTLVGDTLYVAAFQKGVMKISLAGLDSATHSQTILLENTK